MSVTDIAFSDLRLDGENPRHDPTKGEQKTLAALMKNSGPKIMAIAADIATYGLSPIDLPMVVKEGTSYTMIEGNRRLAAVRLLSDPSLAPNPADVPTFTSFAKNISKPISVLTCHVAPNRAAARHWQELRHRGQSGGRGVVPWNPQAINRFFGATSGTTAKAVVLADAIKDAFPRNKWMLADLEAVMKQNSSTLGRLVSDPNFRGRLGIVMKPAFGSHYESVDLERVLMRVLADLTGPNRKRVADFYYQTQREAYLRGLSAILPNPAQRRVQASPFAPVRTPPPSLPSTSGGIAGGATASQPLGASSSTAPGKKRPAQAGPRHLFEGITLSKFSVRIKNILAEMQRLPVDEYPNASGVLTRVIINLAVVEVFQKNGWTLAHPPKSATKPTRDKTFAELVRGCLDKLDPSKKDRQWKVVRVELDKAHGLFTASTLNAFVHDAGFNPVPKDLRLISANFSPFLAALERLLP